MLNFLNYFVLKVACPQSRLSSKSSVLKVVCPQSRCPQSRVLNVAVLNVACPQCPIGLSRSTIFTRISWNSSSLAEGCEKVRGLAYKLQRFF